MIRKTIVGLLGIGFFLWLPNTLYLQEKPVPKVIFISFDGFSQEQVPRLLIPTLKHKGLGRIQQEGQLAKALIPPWPSLTAPSHISLLTGKPPAEHGVVSNRFHTPKTEITEKTDGFSYPIETKTLWEMATDKGLQVASIAFPGVPPTAPQLSWGIPYTHSESPSSVKRFTLEDFKEAPTTLPVTLTSYSPALKTFFSLNEKSGIFQVTALDETNDHTKNYQTFILDSDETLSNGFLGKITLTSPWMNLMFQSQGTTFGSWVRLLTLSPDLTQVTLFIGNIYPNLAYPLSFRDLLEKQIGTWPGGPNFDHPDLTPKINLEQAIRFSDYLASALSLGIEHFGADLVLAYEPLLDELGHHFYMIHSKQKNYSKQKSNAYLKLLHAGYLHANHLIDVIMNRHAKSNLFVVSDHGMAPLHTIFYPNRLLSQRGFIDQELELDDTPDANKKIKYYARHVSSGGTSHVYVNLMTREPAGIVSKDQRELLIQKLIDIYKKEPAVQVAYRKEETKPLGLYHPNTGDLLMVAKPGFHFNDDDVQGPIYETASFYGQHGYDPSLSSMKAVFAAWGPNIPKKPLNEVSYSQVLPMILNVLNIP